MKHKEENVCGYHYSLNIRDTAPLCFVLLVASVWPQLLLRRSSTTSGTVIIIKVVLVDHIPEHQRTLWHDHCGVYLHHVHPHSPPLVLVHGLENSWWGGDKVFVTKCFSTFIMSIMNAGVGLIQRTEHVLQTDNAGEVVVKVDVVAVVSKPQADQLQELVVQVHSFTTANRTAQWTFKPKQQHTQDQTPPPTTSNFHLQLWERCEVRTTTSSLTGRCQRTRRASAATAQLETNTSDIRADLQVNHMRRHLQSTSSSSPRRPWTLGTPASLCCPPNSWR